MTRAPTIARLAAALQAAALLVASGCGGEGEPTQPAARERPDLVLVVVDALRADHLNPYGYRRPTSPALAQLASSGAVFDDNTAQSSATLPSMVSMLTGRAMLCDAQRIPAGVATLAERLAAAGYQTVAFAGNPLVSRAAGFDRGFQVFLTRDETGHETWDARDLHAVVTGWLAENPRDGRPRFFYIHAMDPHFPYRPDDRPSLPGENAEAPLDQRVRLDDDVLETWTAAVTAAGAGTPLFDSFDAERWLILEQIDAYDREIANVDAATGVILDALGTGGRLVVVASDHGEAFWERARPPQEVEALSADRRTLSRLFEHGHGGSLCQELLRTPLIVSGTGFPVGQRITSATSNLDIAPTLLRAAGVTADPSLEGRALQDQLGNGGHAARPPIYSACRTAVAVRDPGGYRLVVPTPAGEALGLALQLYQLSDDPHERRNIAARPLAESREEEVKMLHALREQHDEALRTFRLFDGQSTECDDPAQAKVITEFEESRP